MNAQHSYLVETAYNAALEAVAQGATRDETRGWLFDHYPALSQDEIADVCADALRDARKQGVEREDIDDSWF
jgi:20S proteasome alpha/beta subunit